MLDEVHQGIECLVVQDDRPTADAKKHPASRLQPEAIEFIGDRSF
jgi:hypothetical protein